MNINQSNTLGFFCTWLHFQLCVIKYFYLQSHRNLPLLLLESGLSGVPSVVLAAALVGHGDMGREGVSYETNCSGFWLVHWCGLHAVAISWNVLYYLEKLCVILFITFCEFCTGRWNHLDTYILFCCHKTLHPVWHPVLNGKYQFLF